MSHSDDYQQLEDHIVQRLEKRLPQQRTWRNRLIKLGAITVILIVTYYYLFSCENSPLRGGSDSTSNAQVTPRTASEATGAVRDIYASVANNDQRLGCTGFSPEAAAKFAANMGFGNCRQAIEQLSNQVTEKIAYKNTEITSSETLTSGNNSEVSSCALPVIGGPRLGLFVLRKQPEGGWLITDHQNEPAHCSMS